MQEFIEEIHWLYPNLWTKAIYKMFCSMKGRDKKYWNFWLWKRDWSKFFVSERQMTYFINIMINYWFLEEVWNANCRGFKCRVFRASNQLKKYFTQIKDVVVSKISHLTDRIKEWNNQDIKSYLSSLVDIRRKWNKETFKYNWLKYVIWKRQYEGIIYDTSENRGLNLFDFIQKITWKNVIETALYIKIIW